MGEITEPKVETNEEMIELKFTRGEIELLGSGLVELSLKERLSSGEPVDQAAAQALLKKMDIIENSINK